MFLVLFQIKISVIDSEMSGDVETEIYDYLIIVITGARANAGTTAHVCFTLNDQYGETEAKVLTDSKGSTFRRDEVSAFRVSYSRRLGDVSFMKIWHNNRGKSKQGLLDGNSVRQCEIYITD